MASPLAGDLGRVAAVALFTTLLRIATILALGPLPPLRGFWLWAGLYFTTQFLVVGAGSPTLVMPRPPDPLNFGWDGHGGSSGWWACWRCARGG